MYHMVFSSRFAQFGALSLLVFLLIQPVAPVFAEEIAEETASDIATERNENPAPQQRASAIEALQPEEEKVGAEELVDEAQDNDPEQARSVTDNEDQQDVPEGTKDEYTEMPPADSDAASREDQIIESDEYADETPQESTDSAGLEIGDDVIDPGAAEDDPLLSDEMSDTSASEEVDVAETRVSDTTEAQAPSGVQTVHNTGAYQFDTKECTSVGDGAYYCSDKAADTHFLEDGVFAAPDADGDLEIFVRLSGTETQITFNDRDDSAPYYDPLSQRIVWHSLINDRYQIVSYDLVSRTESIITDTPYNNMEPVAYGSATIWQAWVNDNWEIMFLDEGAERQLSHNTLHDVSPHMREDHVVWQTQYKEGWEISVYDMKTGQITNLPSQNGAKIENPRFVLVYDTTNEAGDVQTMGYDPNENRSFLLNSIPAELPDELPDPDQTGETRALIQNKASVKGNEIEDIEPTPTPTASSSDPHASSTDTLPTLDMRTSTGTLMAASTDTVINDIEDLVVISPIPVAKDLAADHVFDLVIPQSASTTAE